MDDILGKQLENLFDLPQGSMTNLTPDKVTPTLVDQVKLKTNDLNKQLKKTELLEDLPVSELVKTGLTLDQLEEDKELIRNETFEVYRIGKALLMKIYDDVHNQIGVNDRMYVACAKMLDSVNTSLAKLFEMNQKLKQDVEFKSLTVSGMQDDGKTKSMTPDDWMKWVESTKNSDEPTALIPDTNIQDVEESES
jgi:hypothetical protein